MREEEEGGKEGATLTPASPPPEENYQHMSSFTVNGSTVNLAASSLVDPDGEPLSEGGVDGIAYVRPLDEEAKRRLIRGAALNKGLYQLAGLSTDIRPVVCLLLKDKSNEHLAYLNQDGTVELIFVDDAVSYEPISPLQLVEYCYAAPSSSTSLDEEGEWIASCIGRECMDAYTSTKYNLWKDMFLKAFDGCAKAFLPEIKRGYAMTNVYDHMIFPYDPSESSSWEVDHNGKIVKLPRPVRGLRIWNANEGAYDSISPRMAGAPDEAEMESAWKALLQELRGTLNPKYGDEFVDDCLSMSADEVKAKYF